MGNKALCGASRLQVPNCKAARHQKSWKASTLVVKYIVPAIFSTILLVALVYIIFILCRRRSFKISLKTTILPPAAWGKVSYQDMLRATNGFNEDNLLGIGSFDSVCKGKLSDGMVGGIKVFNLEQEEACKKFEPECEVSCNIRHRNLIRIICSCSNKVDYEAIVLNYMPNGSLEYRKRLNIMIDVAWALEYLHHGYSIPIVHCDLKPSNILLDEDLVAHVADFGISRLLGGGDSITQTMRDKMFAEETDLKQWVANLVPQQ